MSAKRQATSNLNHENWDREEEPEERGTFRAAPEDELNKRVIKKARRQINSTAPDASDGDGGASKSVFSGFAGFGKTATSVSGSQAAAAASPFSFLAKLPTAVTSSTSSGANATTISKPTFSFGGAATTTTAVSADDKKSENKTKVASTETSDKSASYYAKLKGLNQSVSDWIKTHVDKNPLCILSPVFKDYENYLKEIEADERKSTTAKVDSSSAKPSTTPTAATFGSFKFSATTTTAATTALTSASAEAKSTSTGNIFGNIDKPASNEKTKANGFSFGLKTDEKSAATTPSSSSSTLAGFSFGKPITNTVDKNDEKKPPTTGFSFTPGATPFSFGNIKPPAAMPTSTSNAEEDDEEDQPPKVEFKQVVENDAVFSKKCKVFIKKDGNFADRGVGTVYLKPVNDSEKTQLLVRADTNLGNILVNLILSEAIPAQRMGKNNVMLVCVPTPDVTKPTPMLLRVKTTEEADELLKAIEKYKK